jgi:hypothetical protein
MTGPPLRQRRALGCLWRAAAVVAVLTAIFVVLGVIFDQGEDAGQPERTHNAGRAEDYARSDTTHLEQEHIFVTRLEDGDFIALYDRSSRQQELGGDCRVRYDDRAGLGSLAQLPGFVGGFVEDCEGTRTVWRADGELAFGAGYGDLDRFETRVNDAGELIIETEERTCTRSRGVPGIPPFETRRCTGTPR